MMNGGPLFGPGGIPQGPVVLTPELKAAQRKLEKVQTCPTCPTGPLPFIVHLIPNPQVMAVRDQNAYARCMRCLTTWEVTNDGTVVNKQTILEQLAALAPRAPFTPNQGEAHGR